MIDPQPTVAYGRRHVQVVKSDHICCLKRCESICGGIKREVHSYAFSVNNQNFHSCAIFLVIANVKTLKGTLFISLKRLRPVYSPYKSLTLDRQGTIMCIFAEVANGSTRQTASSTHQIHWSFQFHNFFPLFSSY